MCFVLHIQMFVSYVSLFLYLSQCPFIFFNSRYSYMVLLLFSRWKRMAFHLNVIDLVCQFKIRMSKIEVWQWTLTHFLMCCLVLRHGTQHCLL